MATTDFGPAHKGFRQKPKGTSSLRRQIFGQKLLGGREEPEQAMIGMDTRASN